MPFAHARWGRQYPGDGQQAVGFILAFLGIGLAAAALFFLMASLLHILRRHRSWLAIFTADVFLGVCFAGLLAYAGVTANYSQTSRSSGTTSTDIGSK